MILFLLAIAPIFILLFYVYSRDKYEKEPLNLLIKGLVAGCLTVILIIPLEWLMQQVISPFEGQHYLHAFGNAYLVAALCEESIKLLAVWLLVWRNPNFNERFDGIVYAVFVSLGFALVENIMYVFGNESGYSVALGRAYTAVPAHAMFGVLMGYYLGLARFSSKKQTKFLWYALLTPIFFHGLYDFILMSENSLLLIGFFPLLIYMVFMVHRRMKEHSENSIFKFLNFKSKSRE